jgi:hypothetical protein
MLVNVCVIIDRPNSEVLVVMENGLEGAVFNVAHVIHMWLFNLNVNLVTESEI